MTLKSKALLALAAMGMLSATGSANATIVMTLNV